MTTFYSKKVSEDFIVSFDFSGKARFQEVLSSPVVTVSVLTGFDANASNILSGAASIANSIVKQKVIDGLPGVIYIINASATGTTGTTYTDSAFLAVVSDVGSYAPSSLPILSGALPAGVVGKPYSANLSIANGYGPYTAIGIIANAPTWMGFSVVGSSLVCAGIPNESGLTNYSFSPGILDAALNTAFSNQNLTVSRITLTGDLPDQDTGSAVNYQYIAANGTAPYTFTISAGALPTGLSISASGLVTGTATASGTFNWTVRAADANGVPATLADTCRVVTTVWWATTTSNIGNNSSTIWQSSDDMATWPVSALRTPNNSGAPVLGPWLLDTNYVMVLGNSGTNRGDIIQDFNPAGGFATSILQLGVVLDANAMVRVFGNIVIILPKNPLASNNIYYISSDFGKNFTTANAPITPSNGRGIVDINRLNNGRWIATVNDGPSSRLLYSNEVGPPTTWTNATAAGAFVTSNSLIACNGNAAVVTLTSGAGGIGRTTDGINWTGLTGPAGTGTGGYDTYASGNVMIVQSSGGGNYMRSTDAGLNWTVTGGWEPLFGFQTIGTGGDIVASIFSHNAGTVYAKRSVDLGLNWTNLNSPPWPITAGLNTRLRKIRFV